MQQREEFGIGGCLRMLANGGEHEAVGCRRDPNTREQPEECP